MKKVICNHMFNTKRLFIQKNFMKVSGFSFEEPLPNAEANPNEIKITSKPKNNQPDTYTYTHGGEKKKRSTRILNWVK